MSSAVLKDKGGKVTEFDTKTTSDDTYGYLITIPIEHHKIHEGDHYVVHEAATVASGTPKKWFISVPATGQFHLTFECASSKNGTIELSEGPTVSAEGTALTAYNSDRNSSNTSNLVIKKDPTSSAQGNVIDGHVMGTDATNPAGTDGGSVSREQEWLLKNSTTYLITYTSLTNANRVSLNLRYYEV